LVVVIEKEDQKHNLSVRDDDDDDDDDDDKLTMFAVVFATDTKLGR